MLLNCWFKWTFPDNPIDGLMFLLCHSKSTHPFTTPNKPPPSVATILVHEYIYSSLFTLTIKIFYRLFSPASSFSKPSSPGSSKRPFLHLSFLS